MIYPERIVETLFENSESVSNDVYVQLMNLMKRYHEFSDNEEEIVNFVNGMDTNIKNKIKKFITEEKKECKLCSFNFNMCAVLFLIIFSLLILVILSYLFVKRDNNFNYFNYYNSTN